MITRKTNLENENPALSKGAVSSLFKISTAWDCIKTFEELVSDAKFIFIGKGWINLTPRLVLKTPINGIDCIEISYDNKGLTNGGECVFSENWGDQIEDSSKDVVTFLREFLEREGAVDILNCY